MFNNKDKMRALAKAITHYVYRNTSAVEDSLSDGVIMDEKFYRKVYKSVYNKMALVKKYNKYYCKIENVEILREFLETINLEKPLEFLSYGQSLSHNFIYGSQWADAEVVDEIPQKALHHIY